MKSKIAIYLSLLLTVTLLNEACRSDDDDVEVPTEEPAVYDDTPYQLEYGMLPPPKIAEDNPLTIEGVKLGRMLFYEKKLSADGSQSCASCHAQEDAFSDIDRFSLGVEGLEGKRQAMSVFNLAWHENEFFWDGRAHLLRDQALLPIQDPLEMNETLENVITKLNGEQTYLDQFKRAFDSEEITEEKISLALEQFMNSIVSIDSKYDRFLRGEESLTASEERGRELFFAEFNPGFPTTSGADCAHCHGGFNFENNRYMNNGLDTDADQDDIGREEVTGMASDRAKFKVTSLRNIDLTPPYMHDGRFATLEEVVDHYNNGLKPSATIDPALEYTRTNGGLGLTQQDKTDLVNFLKTLSDETLTTNEAYSSPFPE